MKSLKKYDVIHAENGNVVASYMLQAAAFDTANALNVQAMFTGNKAVFVVRKK